MWGLILIRWQNNTHTLKDIWCWSWQSLLCSERFQCVFHHVHVDVDRAEIIIFIINVICSGRCFWWNRWRRAGRTRCWRFCRTGRKFWRTAGRRRFCCCTFSTTILLSWFGLESKWFRLKQNKKELFKFWSICNTTKDIWRKESAHSVIWLA